MTHVPYMSHVTMTLLCVSCRPTSTGESPTLVARHLIRRHNQLTLPDSPSQGSTPAELAEEEVSKLSDQVCFYMYM